MNKEQGIKFQWANAIKSENGPKSPTTRYVLLMLSTHMNPNGGSCFPSTATLASETALSERSVCTHLALAEKEGWIQKRQLRPDSKGWRRHEYRPLIPAMALKEIQQQASDGTEPVSAPNEDGTEPPSIGTEPDDNMALKDVQCSSSYSSPKSISYSLSELLLALILKHRQNFKRPNLKKWAEHIDLMIRIDRREPTEIETVIRWAQKSPFWFKNILSTEKLRKQFDQLAMNMEDSKKQNELFFEKKYVGTPSDQIGFLRD